MTKEYAPSKKCSELIKAEVERLVKQEQDLECNPIEDDRKFFNEFYRPSIEKVATQLDQYYCDLLNEEMYNFNKGLEQALNTLDKKDKEIESLKKEIEEVKEQRSKQTKLAIDTANAGVKRLKQEKLDLALSLLREIPTVFRDLLDGKTPEDMENIRKWGDESDCAFYVVELNEFIENKIKELEDSK